MSGTWQANYKTPQGLEGGGRLKRGGGIEGGLRGDSAVLVQVIFPSFQQLIVKRFRKLSSVDKDTKIILTG